MSTLKSFGYTPKLSSKAVFVLRRIAWTIGKPMTTTLEEIVLNAIEDIYVKNICKACKGTKDQCLGCFAREGVPSYHGTNTPSKL